MSCVHCKHCQPRMVRSIYTDAKMTEEIMHQFKLTDLDLEDRRPHRPSLFRFQMAVYLLVQMDLSLNRVGKLTGRDRTSIRKAVIVVSEELKKRPKLADTLAKASILALAERKTEVAA